MISRATLYMLTATLLFAAHNICVKWLSHMPVVQIVFFRGVLSLLICYASLKWMGLSVWGKNKPVLLLRGAFGTVSLLGFFYCIQQVPIAIATVFISLAPVFTVLIAHFLLKERASPLQALFLLGAFAGVVLVKGFDVSVSWSMTAIGVGVGFIAACAYTCVRVLRTTEHPLVVIFYFPVVTLPLMAWPTYTHWQWPQDSGEWLLLVSVGILTQLAQYFMTMAYQMETAAKVMIFNYAGILWALLAGYFLFHETLSLWQIVGVVMVVICLVISALIKNVKVTASPQ